MAQVTLEGVNKHYGADQALFDISLDIPDGAFAVFVGPSGCGKSTLLRSIAGLEGISSGRIGIGGEDVTAVAPSERDVAMVFQSYALYPHMSVRENMDFGMKVNGFNDGTRKERIAEAARILQLTNYLDRKPGQLSGGQRQRVAIGRAIVKQPKVFLFDEPLSNLDAKLRIQMRVELETLHRELEATMIYVTHDQVEAMTMADVIVVLNGGRIEQVGAPMELYHKPATEFVAGFIGAPSMNFLDVSPAADGVAYGDATLSARPMSAPPARAGIRPEHVGLAEPGDGQIDVAVRVKEALGGESYLYTTTASGDEIVVRADGETPIAPGDRAGLTLPEARLHFFARDGARVEA
ncbi:multiple sugar transport system ATP-binding protein [Rhodovulum sp. ES.010]|uniref:ABC transporter ATP-binding protein n=1 Tax=Rhodovulum sp. ES.010 TaxID=1882821 RepID=UPI00092C534F|nr:sn-glycerol-3-phosphate ABC transporter ATP-binding protein UgpC [Rhodovulum sp. ES.010]SIO33518.1 multiple sugar transport system ATP-binding protein [Rhodovulum sp. ES.010]